MLTTILLVADIVLTAAVALLVHFKPGSKVTQIAEEAEGAVKALEGAQAAPSAK